MEKKLKRRIVAAQEQDLKNFNNLQKKEYKHGKERARQVRNIVSQLEAIFSSYLCLVD